MDGIRAHCIHCHSRFLGWLWILVLTFSGGIAIALSQVSQLPAVPLAVLGQVVGIWTGAALIPWGFVAVTSAVAGIEVHQLMKYTIPAYLAAVCCAFGWTLLQL